jgi:hypothetical protein
MAAATRPALAAHATNDANNNCSWSTNGGRSGGPARAAKESNGYRFKIRCWSWQDGFAVTEVPIAFTELATGARVAK